MRLATLVLLLTACLPCTARRAEACGTCTDGFFVWPLPNAKPIPANGHFYVMAFGWWDRWGREAKDGDFVLVAEDGQSTIEMHVVERFLGDREMAFSLRPIEKLVPGRIYSLQVNTGKARRFVYLDLDGSVALWRIGESIDREPPTWRVLPKIAKRVVQESGCPSKGISIEMSAVDGEVPVPILIQLQSEKEGIQRFPCLPDDGTGERRLEFIGSGPCGANVKLRSGMRYELRAVAVDAAGNETPATGTLLLKAP